MNRYQATLGCLLGTAVGDAVGLRREGLSKRRGLRMYGSQPAPDLCFGRGLCSDDTEHTLMVGRALALSAGEPDEFQARLARQFRWWLLALPPGIGLATLRACLKLLVGFRPSSSGVYSAGNGPAMRSALLGVCARSDDHLCELVRCSTRITHTDPRAEEGARLVARAARSAVSDPSCTPVEFLRQSVTRLDGDELRSSITAAVEGLQQGVSCQEFADSQGWSNGISGYVNHSVPAALYCWAHSAGDLRAAVCDAVLMGGDTDSVAAITGAVSGAHGGESAVPSEWLDRIVEWPRTTRWLRDLARSVADTVDAGSRHRPPAMHWLASVPRNLLLASIVLTLGLRRLLPPY